MDRNYFNTNTSENNPATITVAEISKIHFDGNVIPHQWFEAIKMLNGKTDSIGIILLSEIVYWYRSNYQVNENTGKVKPLQKKFKADMLQTSAAFYHQKFGFTKQQVRDALKRLDDGGYIRREYRTITTEMGMKMNNVMFVEPIPSKIISITHKEAGYKKGDNHTQNRRKDFKVSPLSSVDDRASFLKNRLSSIDDTPSCTDETNTEITTKITTKTTTTGKLSSHNKFTGNVNPISSASNNFSSSKSSSFYGSNGKERIMKLGFGAIKWTPQQKQEAIAALEGTKHPQGILNAVNAAYAKGTIKTNPMAYLKALARRDKVGKFNCLDNNNPDNVKQAKPKDYSEIVAEEKAKKEAAKKCDICDSSGYIHTRKANETRIYNCPHGDVAIKLADKMRSDGLELDCDKPKPAPGEGKKQFDELMKKLRNKHPAPRETKSQQAARAERARRESEIGNCSHCDEKGYLMYVNSAGNIRREPCPHNYEIDIMDKTLRETNWRRATRK